MVHHRDYLPPDLSVRHLFPLHPRLVLLLLLV
jgi:hypothetical protein